jgi:NAD(P)-dependent dehydrogenase (short-subunit alcohol dehydrogenase family)
MNNQVALITGASRGIGRAIAMALGERGWGVAINYRENAEAASETLHSVEVAGGSGIPIQADITNADARERLVNETLARYGRIDLLINNAGTAPSQRADLLEVGEASYDEVMAVNLKGAFFLTQRVARVMIVQAQADAAAHPKIINIGSVSAYASSVNRAEYCISKAGMAMLTKLFADRLAEYGILVYELRPGIITTDMTGPVRQKYDRLIARGVTPIRRWGKPEDVARAVVVIAEGGFPFSTGQVIDIDGGFHLHRL